MNKEKIKAFLKKWVQFFLNPRLLLCVFIAWMITNGWSYVFISLGAIMDIKWMAAVGGIYAGLLWFPFTPEKIITAIIAIFLLKLIFPQDKKTLLVLHEQLEKAKRKHRERKEKKKRETKCSQDGQNMKKTSKFLRFF